MASLVALTHVVVHYYNTFVKKVMVKIGCHNLTVLYPNQCYNQVCYKGIAYNIENYSVSNTLITPKYIG